MLIPDANDSPMQCAKMPKYSNITYHPCNQSTTNAQKTTVVEQSKKGYREDAVESKSEKRKMQVIGTSKLRHSPPSGRHTHR
jgi:hypothetical protein